MDNFTALPAKMLIAFVGRRRGEMLVEAAKAAGARGGTIAFGKSLADNRVLQALSLADVQQDVVVILLTEEQDQVIPAIRAAADEDPKKLNGMAVLVNVPEIFTRATHAIAKGKQTEKVLRSEEMDSGYKLVCVIVNDGYADDVMAMARKAGAQGGSIISARGTGTEEDVKFFGITLVPEKEMLLIVTTKNKVKGIIEAISTVPTLNEPGGGIIFNLNVEEFIVLGRK